MTTHPEVLAYNRLIGVAPALLKAAQEFAEAMRRCDDRPYQVDNTMELQHAVATARKAIAEAMPPHPQTNTLPTSLQREAALIGSGLDACSLEQGEPA